MIVMAMIAVTTTKTLGIGENRIMIVENREIKVGDEVRVGMELMIVDEVTEFDTVIVIGQDGDEYELTENEIDIYTPASLAYLRELER